MNSTTPLVDAAVNDTAFEDKNQPHTDWITAHAGREIEEKMNEARRELAHARDMLTVANETSAAADCIRIGLERELNESHAREAQLRAALSDASSAISTRIDGKLVHAYVREQFPATDGHIPLNEYFKTLGSAIANIAGALTLPAPPVVPVVPVEDVKPLIKALADVIALATFWGPDRYSNDLERAKISLSTFTAKHKI